MKIFHKKKKEQENNKGIPEYPIISEERAIVYKN